MTYETKFENGNVIDTYMACACVEGFAEGENASDDDRLKAWSYLIGTKVAYKLQGWYGRHAVQLIELGYFDEDGTILKKP